MKLGAISRFRSTMHAVVWFIVVQLLSPALAISFTPPATHASVWVYLNPDTSRFWSMDSHTGENEDPLSLHKYLYVVGNPVNGIDPSGHMGLFKFTRDFGNWAHRVIENEYQAEHPGAICGTTTGILGTGLKPDIFDGPNRVFMEIKPLSLSGVAKGIFQIGIYDAAFTAFNLDYSRGTWPSGVRESNVGPTPIVYFNVQGVIFYTDMVDNLDDIAELATFTLARQFITSNLAKMSRTLVGAMPRIAVLANSRAPADTVRLFDQVGIAGLLASMGAF